MRELESESGKESESNFESESEIQSPSRRVAVRVTVRELEPESECQESWN